MNGRTDFRSASRVAAEAPGQFPAARHCCCCRDERGGCLDLSGSGWRSKYLTGHHTLLSQQLGGQPGDVESNDGGEG